MRYVGGSVYQLKSFKNPFAGIVLALSLPRAVDLQARLGFMKAVFTKLLVCGWLLVAGAAGARAQGGDQLGGVRSAIASGSSHDLAQYLAPSVEVGFDGDSQNMSATQTELVLKNFFAKNSPGKFEIVHQGASPDGIPYVAGRYTGRSGTYQVFIKLKANRNAPQIDKIDFTKG
ncbi:MAG: DUF4783 domain-containing protein [Hymenobacter sp.]|nr:MAG: DUF4783 domain-containing protein [Hymenobacter sp.]